MEILIKTFIEEDGSSTGCLQVETEGKKSGALATDECLGLIASLIIPESRPCLQWLKTPEEEKRHKDHIDLVIKQNRVLKDNPVEIRKMLTMFLNAIEGQIPDHQGRYTQTFGIAMLNKTKEILNIKPEIVEDDF